MARPKGQGETPKHNVRVPDDVWNPAKERAKREQTKITTVIVSALRQYAADGTIPLSDALTSRLIAQADARARAQRGPLPLPDTAVARLRELKQDVPAGPVFPRQVQMRTYLAGEKVLFDSAQVSKLLRSLAALSVTAAELEQMADQLDMAALTALDDQRDG